MDSGKLDEELVRLSHIVDGLTPGTMLLMNESFASTTAQERAAIACEITGGLCRAAVKILFVTHLHEYAQAMERENLTNVRLLRAERCDDGTRTFAIRQGISLPTSYGMDLFEKLIGQS